MSGISRRKILWVLGGMGGSLAAATILGYRFFWSPFKDLIGMSRMGLTPREWQIIGLLVDEIFPRNDGFPSGVEAGVLNYMERALKGDLPGWLPSNASIDAKVSKPILGGYRLLVPHYVKVVKRLDEISQNVLGLPFDKVPASERTRVVSEFSKGSKADVGYNVKGNASLAGSSDGDLFELIRRHSIEGYFSDPSNGGNKDYSAWEAIKHTCHLNYKKENGCK